MNYMAQILSGKEVAAALNEKLKLDITELKEKGICPTLATIRIGEADGDIAYERGASKRCESLGVDCRKIILPRDVSEEQLLNVIDEMNRDDSIHGVLLFRPLPKHIDQRKIENALKPEKDVDCMTNLAMYGVFAGTDMGYPPCTPQACMEILDYYGIDVKGKKVVVVGRSLVVGKPLAMMALQKNATVTICHTKTVNMQEITKTADVIIAAVGRAGVITDDYLREGQIVIDVGINVNEEGRLCGDVAYEQAEKLVGAITPVPGGVGSVTTAVLMKHVVQAAYGKC